MNNKELMHYGVIGMKWGKRRARTQAPEYTNAKKLQKKKLSELSNDELKTLNTRMDLESRNRQLKRQNIGTGKKVLIGILAAAGTQVAVSYVKKYMQKGVDYGDKKLVNVFSKSVSKLKNNKYGNDLLKEAIKKNATLRNLKR